jgi:hypoxanthine phosphoribosyltransferase
MEEIKEEVVLHDLRFRELVSSSKVQECVKSMADQISADLQGEIPIFLPVLNGAFRLASDLASKVEIPCTFSFIKMKSYEGTKSTEVVNELIGLDTDISGKTVVVVEDIVDTGNTLEKILTLLEQQNPRKILISSLLLKPEVYNHKRKIDFLGMEISDKFVVGYGLDYDGRGRELNAIYQKVDD